MTELVIAGDSHILALGVPLNNSEGRHFLAPIPGQGTDVFGLVGTWPRVQDQYWSAAAENSVARAVGYFWAGNQHLINYLFAPSPLFDFVASASPDLPLIPDADIVPEAAVREVFQPGFQAVKKRFDQLSKSAGTLLVAGTPPPKEDDDFIRAKFGREPYFQRAAEKLGLTIERVPLSPPLLRLKLWMVVQDLLRELAHQVGATFVPVPSVVQTDTGFLAREYYAEDVTHANRQYGAIMIGQLRSAADPSSVIQPPGSPLITQEDRVVTAGSCFAANLIPYLEGAGFSYVRTEYTNPVFAKIPPENYSYSKFSAGYGNIYTARQLYQLLLRSLGEFAPAEVCWKEDGKFVDPFRPALTYAARSEQEFEVLSAAHLRAVRRAFTECSVFIFTLGLTEGWVATADGTIYPACPGTIAGEFDSAKYEFVNFSVDDVVDDMSLFVKRLREINPRVRIILTVSPVPLVATASGQHVLSSTVYSKSVLRVAAETIRRAFDDVHYFPAYEIVTGPQAPSSFFEPDKRNVTKEAVETVMGAFLAACGADAVSRTGVRPTQPTIAERLSATLTEADCEEAAQAMS